MKNGIVLAQQTNNTPENGGISDFQGRFGLGFYAGINDPINAIGKVSDMGPSFIIYASYNISNHWQAEVGFGGVFYYGKPLSYMGSKNIFDTVYAKNAMVTGLAYTTVPVIFKYKLSGNIQILAGLRWLGVSSVYGNGTYGIYSLAHKDSFIFKSNIVPNLPQGANVMDVQGLAGLELSFSKHLSASLMLNLGWAPIYQGNYNDAIELGLNYTFALPKMK